MGHLVVIVFASSLLFGAQGPQPAPRHRDEAEKRELEKLSGVWMQAGDNVAPEYLTATVVYKGREFEGKLGDQVLFTGQVRLDPTKSPKQLDLTLDTGPNKGKTFLGIYELDDKNYRGCLAVPGKPRPTSLTPEPRRGQQTFAFRRAPKAKDRPEPVQAELKRFEGNWYYVSVIVNGRPAPEASLKTRRLVLHKDQFTLTRPELAQHGTYTVDPLASPKVIDVTFSDGPRAGVTIKGIYELSGDTCKICMAPEDDPRPLEFASRPGSGLALEVLKRTKP